VLDDPDPQGHALLGGYVYVTTGAIARLGSEAELAALLAHEVAHVALDHGDGLLEIDDDLVLSDPGAVRRRLAHARDDESEADERAVALLVAAGYDPTAMLAMLRRVDCAPDPIDPLDRLHEPLDRRLARIARAIDGRAGGERGEARYLAQLPAAILPARASDRTISSSCGGPGQPSPRRVSSPRSPRRRSPRAR
jgi:predicted Zn-dependent protease